MRQVILDTETTGLEVQRGHRIIEFKQQRANLEEIFMNVTKGAVQ